MKLKYWVSKLGLGQDPASSFRGRTRREVIAKLIARGGQPGPGSIKVAEWRVPMMGVYSAPKLCVIEYTSAYDLMIRIIEDGAGE